MDKANNLPEPVVGHLSLSAGSKLQHLSLYLQRSRAMLRFSEGGRGPKSKARSKAPPVRLIPELFGVPLPLFRSSGHGNKTKEIPSAFNLSQALRTNISPMRLALT